MGIIKRHMKIKKELERLEKDMCLIVMTANFFRREGLSEYLSEMLNAVKDIRADVDELMGDAHNQAVKIVHLWRALDGLRKNGCFCGNVNNHTRECMAATEVLERLRDENK